MTIEQLYQERLNGSDQWKDLIPRMADLRRYASLVGTVVEFGTRSGNSTTAFLAGGALVTSYDIEDPKFVCPDEKKPFWTLVMEDTSRLVKMSLCDLLFIDSIHTREQVAAELSMAKFVKKYILLHDVIEWGWNGEQGKQGINYAIYDFLCTNSEWRIKELLVDRWGILVLEKDE